MRVLDIDKFIEKHQSLVTVLDEDECGASYKIRRPSLTEEFVLVDKRGFITTVYDGSYTYGYDPAYQGKNILAETRKRETTRWLTKLTDCV